MSARQPLRAGQRFDVFRRDGFTCQYCGARPPAVVLHVDHVVAIANGGTNDDSNLITSCSSCNLGKGAKDLSVAPLTLAQRLAVEQEKEAQVVAYTKFVAERDSRIDREVWEIAIALFGEPSMTLAQRASVRRFLADLPKHEALEAARLANIKERSDDALWLYFCGVCWRKIKYGGFV